MASIKGEMRGGDASESKKPVFGVRRMESSRFITRATSDGDTAGVTGEGDNLFGVGSYSSCGLFS